jgi:hypothetical protein
MSDDYLLVKNMFYAFLYSSGPKQPSIYSVQICIKTNMTGQAGACIHMYSCTHPYIWKPNAQNFFAVYGHIFTHIMIVCCHWLLTVKCSMMVWSWSDWSVKVVSPGKIQAVLRIRDVYPGSRIPDPDFYPSRISDPRSKNSNKREG